MVILNKLTLFFKKSTTNSIDSLKPNAISVKSFDEKVLSGRENHHDFNDSLIN